MKTYNFYGLRRSGNHAILEWLIQNMGGPGNRNIIRPRRIIQRGRTVYINEANTYPSRGYIKRDITFCQSTFENVIVAYEDVPTDYFFFDTPDSHKIVILRDIFNLFSSRYKYMTKHPEEIERYSIVMRTDEKAIEVWKEHANSNALIILFEKWIESKDYRDSICEKLGISNYDITDTMTEFGEGSSFTGQKKPTVEELKSRSKMVNLPQEVINRLNQPDITEIRQRLGFIEPIKITVLGDSHSLVFNHYEGTQYRFNVSVVHGATARGAINPNTKTNSLAIYKENLEKTKSDKIAIMLGEVDCGYLIWYKNKFEGLSVESQLEESISKLSEFVKLHVNKYYKTCDIILIASPPPTIKDNTDKKFLAGARSAVDTPLNERMKLTLEYNRRLKEIADIEGYNYIDIMDKVTEGFNVKYEYLSEDPHDHHLNPKTTIDLWIEQLDLLK
jgi:hypothetical protein